MKVIDGHKVATPAYDHEVRSTQEMDDGVLYPISCFQTFQLPRGRSLAEALKNDPIAPQGVPILTSKCFSKAAIVAYLASYGETFCDTVDEMAAAIRPAIEAQNRARKAADQEIADMIAEHRREMQGMKDQALGELKRVVDALIAKQGERLDHQRLKTCGVYFLRKGTEIVYIGQSVNVFKRLEEHKRQKDFDAVDFLPCAREQLDDMEGFLIRVLRPKLNGYRDGWEGGAPKSKLWDDLVSLPWFVPRG